MKHVHILKYSHGNMFNSLKRRFRVQTKPCILPTEYTYLCVPYNKN
jgi:hypothetical protein